MNAINQPPIFCDNCSTLALAELEGAPLCEHCLLDALRDSRDLSFIDGITPLRFQTMSANWIVSTYYSGDEAA